MKTKEEVKPTAADKFYLTIIEKLSSTISTYKQLPGVSSCGETFEPLEPALDSKDAQINHLLSITNCLLKYVPNSPYMDEIFTNFLKDYIHLVNPQMPSFIGPLYLSEDFINQQEQKQKWQKQKYNRFT